MPKMKTRRGAAKRFSVTGSGLVKRGKANRRHLLSSKNRKRKRQLRHDITAKPADTAKLLRQIPYM